MATDERALKCSTLHTRELGIPHVADGQSGHKRYYRLYLPRILCHGGVRRRLDAIGDHGGEDDVALSPSLRGNDVEDSSSSASWGEAAEVGNEDHLHPHRHAQEEDDDGYYNGHHYHVGTLPVVFLLHSFGSDSHSLSSAFVALADTYHFVLAMPEGLENSFNAGDCCGYALENDVDDVGFLNLLKAMLVSEFDFLAENFVYGIGHNNGAFLLTHALENEPNLFRAIVPISGYTHKVDLIRSGLGMGGNGIGMMLHHSLDDSLVRPSGCCDNSNLPKCHGDISSDWCMSVLQIVDLWARQVNKCGNDGQADQNAFGSYIGGRSGDMAYSLSYESGTQSTVLSLMPDTSNPGSIDTLFKTNLPMSVGYNDPQEGVICLSPTSPSCVANSTVCLYTNREDFRRGDADFGTEFIMKEQVMDFIARDACSVNDGMLEIIPGNEAEGRPKKHVCACLVSGVNQHEQEYGGVFCYDPLNEDGTFMTLPASSKANVEKPVEKTEDTAPEKNEATAPSTTTNEASGMQEQVAAETNSDQITEAAEKGEEDEVKEHEIEESAQKPDESETTIKDEAEATEPNEAAVTDVASEASNVVPPAEEEQLDDTEMSTQTTTESDVDPVPETTNEEVLPLVEEPESITPENAEVEGTLIPGLETAAQDPPSVAQPADTSMGSAPAKDYDADVMSQVFPSPSNHEQHLIGENGSSISSENAAPITINYDITEEHHGHAYMTWAFFLLALFAVAGLLLQLKRRRKKPAKSRSNLYKDDDEDSLYQDCFRSGSPYRDYFQRGISDGSSNHYVGTVTGSEDAMVDREIEISLSMEDEHIPPYQYRGDSELISRGKDRSSRSLHDDIYGGLEWDEHLPPFRCPPSFDDSPGTDNGYVTDGLPAVDDFSFDRRGSGEYRVDDSSSLTSHKSQPIGSTQNTESQAALSESLMSVISAPAFYLNSADRRMLRKYRQEQGKDKIIRKRDSELEDSDRSPGLRSSFSDIKKELGLDEDLKRIEESKTNNMIGLI